jgi:hypothetical protein
MGLVIVFLDKFVPGAATALPSFPSFAGRLRGRLPALLCFATTICYQF